MMFNYNLKNLGSNDHKILSSRSIMKVLEEEVPANLVPAAAVRRGGQALFFITGRKGCVGRLLN
jgi:hypothetical protein